MKYFAYGWVSCEHKVAHSKPHGNSIENSNVNTNTNNKRYTSNRFQRSDTRMSSIHSNKCLVLFSFSLSVPIILFVEVPQQLTIRQPLKIELSIFRGWILNLFANEVYHSKSEREIEKSEIEMQTSEYELVEKFKVKLNYSMVQGNCILRTDDCIPSFRDNSTISVTWLRWCIFVFFVVSKTKDCFVEPVSLRTKLS